MGERKRYVLVEAQLAAAAGRRQGGDRHREPGDDRRWRSSAACACASRRRASPAPTTSRSTTSTRRRRCCRSTGCPTTSTSRARRRRSRSSSTPPARSSSGCTSSTSRARSTNLNELMATANDADRRRSTRSGLQASAERTLAQDRGDARRDRRRRSCPTRRRRSSPSCARPTPSSRRRSAARRSSKLPEDASAAIQQVRTLVADPEARPVGRAPRAHARRASTGIFGGGEQDLGVDDREPAPDHRQPARPHRGREALSGERDLRLAAAPAGAHAMTDHSPRRPARALVVALLCATLAACSLTRPPPVKETYLLEPADAAGGRAHAAAVACACRHVNVAAPFRGRQFVYRDGRRCATRPTTTPSSSSRRRR